MIYYNYCMVLLEVLAGPSYEPSFLGGEPSQTPRGSLRSGLPMTHIFRLRFITSNLAFKIT
jgi:hypothetical protein